jgi:hypothetical protein
MKTMFSSDFIRFHQNCFFLSPHAHGKKNHIENQTKPKKHAPKTKLHCSHFDIKTPSVQPFCFCSNGEAKAMKKAMKSTSAKGKQTSGKGN